MDLFRGGAGISTTCRDRNGVLEREEVSRAPSLPPRARSVLTPNDHKASAPVAQEDEVLPATGSINASGNKCVYS